MKLKLFFLLMVAVFSLILPATGSIVYVDTIGGDYTCDGTDDHIQINQALAFVGTNASYDTVHLNGSNTYWINQTLNMYGDTIFEGDSDAEIKLVANAAWDAYVPMISNTTAGSNNFTIRNFRIDGNSENQPESLGQGYYNMMSFLNCYNVTADNMRLEWSHGDGLKVSFTGSHIEKQAHVTFTNNSIYKLGHDALYVLRLNNVTAANNDIHTRTNSGIRLSDSGNATVYNNTIHSSLLSEGSTGPGLEIDKNDGIVQQNIEIYNNTFHTLKGSGIWITNEDNEDVIRGYDVHIHHNTFYNVGQYHIDTGYTNAAITIGQSNNTIIENNIIDNGGHAGIKYYIKPVYYHINAAFTTIVQNNIIINSDGQTTDPPGPGTGIWNCDDVDHTFISENNCIYNNTGGAYNGTNITHSNDIQVNPLFYDESNYNYHLNSTIGTWNSTGSWELMDNHSPCIDAGKTTSDYILEPTPNGDRINIGVYGNTIYASKSQSDEIIFISPTLSNNSITSNNHVEINTSIKIWNSLAALIWNWNGTNFTFFNNSCVMYISFNNNSAIGENSTTVVDVSPTGANGSFINGANGTWTDGAMYFDGTVGEGIWFVGSPDINDNQLTITAKINISAYPVGQIGGVIHNKVGGWYFEIDDTGELEAYLYDTTNPGYHKTAMKVPLQTDVHVSMTYNGTNITLYIDDSYQMWATTGNIVATGDAYVGGIGNRPFNGSIYEIQEHRRWLNHAGIKQIGLSELYKHNSTQWYFSSNQTNLSEGEYNYQIFANNVESDYRIVTYSAEEDEKFVAVAATFITIVFAATASRFRRVRGFINRRIWRK